MSMIPESRAGRALILALVAGIASAREYHVAVTGSDGDDGSAGRPLRSIQAAAQLAQPGDAVTVHAGIYRERVDPPRGDVVYQAARGEKVVITGAERLQGWVRVTNDTWKVTIPNAYFGTFNPFADKVQGEWCEPTGRHAGMVYLDGEWLAESLALAPVMQPAGKSALWFAKVDGADPGTHLFAIKSVSINSKRRAADAFSAKQGELRATACADGDGNCVGWIRAGSWVAFDEVDFDLRANGETGRVEIVAGALEEGGEIELRAGGPRGTLLGTCRVTHTGGWQKWAAFTAPVASVSGRPALYLVFEPHRSEGNHTTVWAQFPGLDPNAANVEINVRQSVFYPSKPGIDDITVRGFELRQAATPWAGAMSEQIGLVGTHWSKGWVIESNHIHHSMCTGITLGRYELPQGEMPPATAPGFVKSIEVALRDGWSKETIGSHIVRNNHIHHCEKNAIHGSLGACFSKISGNDIHDIALTGWVRGADTAGIKFLGGVDVTITGNHIYRCGNEAGIWLDWMAQGAQVTGNLLHDNSSRYGDMFCEVNHGPLVVANNISLSAHAHEASTQGGAYAHNLITGSIHAAADMACGGRQTPFLKAHATQIAGLSQNPLGDVHWHNNLFIARFNLATYDTATLPVSATGNVYLDGAQPSKFDTKALVKPNSHAGVKIVNKEDAWYLEIKQAPAWALEQKRQLVTSQVLGKAVIPQLPFENPDGSPTKVDTDYFGKPRSQENPFPGPFETPVEGEIKVWPKT